MAEIRPFRCIRPHKEVASQVAALPYDVYDRKEAKEVVEKNPRSFLAIDRAETQFPDDVDLHDPRVYEKAREMLADWQRQGILEEDPEACYYIYQLTMDGRSQTGIVACASVDDYVDGIIRKHENTREDKEQDRICHVDITGAHTGPIFLAYRSQEELNRIVAQVCRQEPLYDFVAEDGIGHRVWKVGNEWTERIHQIFAEMPAMYIADGHHRAASAVKVGLKRRRENPGYTGEEPFNYFLAVLFPDDQLRILPYNRVVKDLNGYNKEEFLAQVAGRFQVEPCLSGQASATEPTGEPALDGGQSGASAPVTGHSSESTFTAGHPAEPWPSVRHHVGMYLDGQWYELTVKPEYVNDDPVKGLDVSLLQDLLLAPVLGIGDPRTDSRIRFVGGIRGLKELERLVDGGEGAVAFAMYPTSIRELFDVADAGLLMPPKSTWFEPKLRSGLFIHRLSE